MSHSPKPKKRTSGTARSVLIGAAAGILFFAGVLGVRYSIPQVDYYAAAANADTDVVKTVTPPPTLDKAAYDAKMLAIANYKTVAAPTVSTHSTSSVQASSPQAASSTPVVHPWPVKNLPYPNAGALLPFNRIVAYYGNFYSKGMGVLGQYPPDVMLQKLASTTAQWRAADPSTPVIPAIHYIVATAQGSPGANGMYSAMMPDSQIDIALALAAKIHGLVFLDFQVGLSTLQKELPQYAKYLALPNVELGIDPEFAMHAGAKPGTVIGSLDAADVNYAANFLAGLVKGNNLPPKILVVHRFTEDMLTHYKKITPLPEVQIVIDMDGWGSQAKKIGTYTNIVAAEPVQFTGFKLFYKNDLLSPSTGMLTPAQVLKLTPQPMYIQYQ